MIKLPFSLGMPDERRITLRGNVVGFWRSNVPWPGVFYVHMPNGNAWDAASFHGLTRENPFPLDEECEVRVAYTGYVPPHMIVGSEFLLLINQCPPLRSEKP